MARQPLPSPTIQRSQYLADALQQMRAQPPQMSSGLDLGTNLLAQALTQWGSQRADRAAQSEMEAQEAARRERLAPLLGMFGGQGQGQAQPQGQMPGDAVSALLGPDPSQQPPVQAVQGGVPSWEQAAPLLAALAAEGEDVDPYRNLIRDAQPDLQVDAASGQVFDPRNRAIEGTAFSRPTVVNNRVVDMSDPSNIERFIPQVPEGSELLYDGQGNPRITPIPDYIEGQAALEGAIAGAREGATAPIQAQFDLVQVEGPDGAPMWIPRSQALGGVRGQDPRIAQLREGLPFAQNQLARVVNTTGVLDSEIGRAMEIIRRDPGVTGLIGTAQARIPGTPAYDLAQILTTVSGNVGFNSLQELRAASATGGGVGALTERELAILSSLLGSLAQGQSGEALTTSLNQIQQLSRNAARQAQESFRTTYGPVLPGAQGQQGQSQGQARRRTYNPRTGRLE